MIRSERIAERIGVHPVVLRRILGRLRADGIVEGRSGPGGGWAIAKDPATLGLGRVWRSLGDGRADESDRLAEALRAAEDAYARELDRITVSDLQADL